MPFLYALTLLVGAALLFVVQPMMAKMVLPLLGGSPAVWNTCMVFFQAALLAGYAYAHAATARLRPRAQVVVHALLLLAPLAFLPLAIPQGWVGRLPTGTDPTPWLLGLLLATVGLPFFVVSATAPLLQGWFARTGHPAARDPYFLYGASNLGSMAALLGYPLAVEPRLRLADQGRWWAAGYAALAALVLACAATAWRAGRGAGPGEGAVEADPAPRPGAREWLRWVALAAVPSSLMLGVTTYLTTDIAAVPLLWVVPLALYLLSFIVVFARRPILPHAAMLRAFPMAVVLLTLLLALRLNQLMLIAVHLLTFFLAAMVCHGELVRRRPAARHLTGFYLAMSLGGVLGGVFNALVAPLIFTWVAEYPLALATACLALPAAAGASQGKRALALDLAIPAVMAVVLGVVLPRAMPGTSPTIDSPPFTIAFSLAVFACFVFKDRPLRFGLAIGATLLASQMIGSSYGRVLEQRRNFFGVLRVAFDEQGHSHRLIHSNTLHGQQSLDPDRRREPMTYFQRSGPIGDVFAAFNANPARPSVGVVGLGVGTLACYAEPGQRWDYYEIDPAVVEVARDARYFTFLRDCRAASLDVRLGDARLRLRDAADGAYGLLVLDAFSSDAIPMHLLTREAIALYRAKLAPGGLIAYHISNRYIELAPVLGALARDGGLAHRVRRDLDVTRDQIRAGKFPSIWVVMAASESDLGALASDPRWKPAALGPAAEVWTDDSSNIINHLILGR